MTTIPNGSAAQPTTVAAIEVEPEADVQPAAHAAAAYVELLNEPPPAEQAQPRLGKLGRFSIKRLLSSAAIFLSLMLILGAIFMHVKQQNRLGRINYNYGEEELKPQMYYAANETSTPTPTPLDELCLWCIAQTRSRRNPVKCGDTNCGIYGISKFYWQDALLSPYFKANEANPFSPDHFERSIDPATDYEGCVSDSGCGAAIVRGYMELYGRDCNGDGVIECQDHIMLHMLGPTGCKTQPLPDIFRKRMEGCMEIRELKFK
ncbi:hypothetical protein KR093_006275 [Drosophila rubida]|uniref:lysozyme n=1 Tax=Drosophila rubida TaxID=30044 RepID=A0AAD4K029_9MUSC|nr:hypothetical protein KR093_006275 [Drosophila rubida]